MLTHRLTQKILLCTMYFLMYVFADFKIEGKEHAKSIKRGPVLIITNHKGLLDPPLIGLAFPFFSKIYPLRFITKDGFFKNFFSRMLFKSMGCFPAKQRGGLEESMKKPAELLREGATVIFFPEGRIVNEDAFGDIKLGVGVLALRFPEIPILPVAIFGTNCVNGFNLFINRPKIRMKVGKPFLLEEILQDEKDAKKISNILMGEIRKMYESISR